MDFCLNKNNHKVDSVTKIACRFPNQPFDLKFSTNLPDLFLILTLVNFFKMNYFSSSFAVTLGNPF